jgi:hypothetical protein
MYKLSEGVDYSYKAGVPGLYNEKGELVKKAEDMSAQEQQNQKQQNQKQQNHKQQNLLYLNSMRQPALQKIMRRQIG